MTVHRKKSNKLREQNVKYFEKGALAFLSTKQFIKKNKKCGYHNLQQRTP